MKRFKRWTGLFLAGVLALSVCGCGSKDVTAPSTEENTEEATDDSTAAENSELKDITFVLTGRQIQTIQEFTQQKHLAIMKMPDLT